jgi:hypothetical protein
LEPVLKGGFSTSVRCGGVLPPGALVVDLVATDTDEPRGGQATSLSRARPTLAVENVAGEAIDTAKSSSTGQG